MAKRKSDKPNISALSRELGISRSSLHRWAREGMDLSDKRAVLLRAAEVAGKAGDQDAMREAKITYWQARAEREQLAVKREAGELISAEGLFEEAQGTGQIFRARIEALENRLPPLLTGLGSAEMVKPLREALREVCQTIADDLETYVDDLVKKGRK